MPPADPDGLFRTKSIFINLVFSYQGQRFFHSSASVHYSDDYTYDRKYIRYCSDCPTQKGHDEAEIRYNTEQYQNKALIRVEFNKVGIWL